MLPALEITEGEEIDGRLFDGCKGYGEKYGVGPSVIRMPGTGILVVGRSVDDAMSLEKEYRESGGTSREMALPWNDSTDEGDTATRAAPRAAVVENRVSVVTGGAQGFGESIVRELAAAGSIVCVADINDRGARGLCDELNEQYGRTTAISVAGDVSDEQSVSNMVDTIVEQVGGIDLFVSNAGVLKAGGVREIALDAFAFVTRVNYIGYFLCVKHVAPIMALQNRYSQSYFSDIIQINSKSGLQGSNKNSAYAGGKFGGIGLTQSFALELIEDNIKVNAICPGNFFEGPLWSDPEKGLFVQYLAAGKVPAAKTVADVKKFYEDKVPMKRGCTGADVVTAIYYIIEQKYETGQAIPVTGGQIMLA
ncbi:MAG: sorbitol-6-phosphate 2-dehydrogenase [Spirochaetales bacterium]|nr:sorbitol-6-phosphate 2-dehydrogenase [Spirochaetales bacterium]